MMRLKRANAGSSAFKTKNPNESVQVRELKHLDGAGVIAPIAPNCNPKTTIKREKDVFRL